MSAEDLRTISGASPNRRSIRTRLRRDWPIIAVVSLFLVLGVAYSVINPLHEATDELRHYRFIQHLIQRKALPIQGELPCSTQGHHPPLFYATAALVTAWIDTGRDVCHEPPGNPFWAYRYWEVGRDNKNQYLHGPDEAFPWHGEALAAHLSRFVNLLFGAAAVWLTWATARLIWPHRPWLAVGSATFIAYNPMFIYMAAAVNNDVIAALAGAAVTFACVRLLLDEGGLTWRWGVWLGLLYGIALLSKFNLAAIIVVIEAAVTWVAWRRGQWRQWFVANALIVLVAGLLAGWWFGRNQLLYGEPTGFERLTELWGVRNPRDSFRLAVSELPYAWTSLWGRFGYGQIPLPQAFYIGVFVIALLSAAGYVVTALRRRTLRSAATVPLLLLALNVLVFFGVLFNYLLVSPAGPMGRFFFPALPSLAILMFYGLRLLFGRRSGADRVLALIANGGMVAFSLVALFGYLAPAYARPPGYDATAELPNPVDIRFDTLAALRGYRLSPDTVRPGEPIDIELYWEVTGRPPGDYLLFVHLLDEATGALAAQRDTHPGLGNFPSSQWQPGDRFVERLQLYLPETAYTPSEATLSVGLYAPGAYRLGVTDGTTGAGLGDSFTLGKVTLLPAAPQGAEMLPNPGSFNFENKIRLLGYEYGARTLAPGEPLELTLFWEALRPNPGDYQVQVRLIDENDAVVASYQERPAGGQRPTTTWEPDEVIADQVVIPLDPALAGGTYTVQVALEDAAADVRLNLIHPDGRWIGDELRLSPIVIRP